MKSVEGTDSASLSTCGQDINVYGGSSCTQNFLLGDVADG